MKLSETTRADALALFRAREFDESFPADDMEPSIRGRCARWGRSDAGGRVRFDTGEREGKAVARLLLAGARADEVYLVLRPHGGQTDWRRSCTSWARAALRVHASRPSDGVSLDGGQLDHRRLRDAVRPSDPGQRVAASLHGTREEDHAGVLRAAGFEELHFLRRYCAKLVYETQLYGGDVPWGALPDLYVETLTGATTFRYSRADAFVDVGSTLLLGALSPAWQLQALDHGDAGRALRRGLVAKPARRAVDRAGVVLRGTARTGAGAGERVSGKGLSFAPLIRSIERMLG
jgi:hypothetical protein